MTCQIQVLTYLLFSLNFALRFGLFAFPSKVEANVPLEDSKLSLFDYNKKFDIRKTYQLTS